MSMNLANKRNLSEVRGLCLLGGRVGPGRWPGSPYSVFMWLSGGNLFRDSGLHTSAQTHDEIAATTPEFTAIKMPWGVSQGTPRHDIHTDGGQDDGGDPGERGELFDGFEAERLRGLCRGSQGIGGRLSMGLDRSCFESVANIWRMTC